MEAIDYYSRLVYKGKRDECNGAEEEEQVQWISTRFGYCSPAVVQSCVGWTGIFASAVPAAWSVSTHDS
jgi:hypothetical protein